MRWTIREASARGMAVHAVIVWEVPIESTFGDMATVGDFHPVIAAEQILVTALGDVGAADTDLTVTTTPVQEHPAEVLMQQAERAELLVVGSRGHGKIFGALRVRADLPRWRAGWSAGSGPASAGTRPQRRTI